MHSHDLLHYQLKNKKRKTANASSFNKPAGWLMQTSVKV
jgi:hypothetical protein